MALLLWFRQSQAALHSATWLDFTLVHVVCFQKVLHAAS